MPRLRRQWREDSSLEKWFPITAKRLAALEAERRCTEARGARQRTAQRDGDSGRA